MQRGLQTSWTPPGIPLPLIKITAIIKATPGSTFLIEGFKQTLLDCKLREAEAGPKGNFFCPVFFFFFFFVRPPVLMMDLPAVKATGVNDKPIKFSKNGGGGYDKHPANISSLGLFTSSAPRSAGVASPSDAVPVNCCYVSYFTSHYCNKVPPFTQTSSLSSMEISHWESYKNVSKYNTIILVIYLFFASFLVKNNFKTCYGKLRIVFITCSCRFFSFLLMEGIYRNFRAKERT